MNEGKEIFRELVIARSDTSEWLDAVEDALDQIATPVWMLVELTGIEPVGTWRDDGLASLRQDRGDTGGGSERSAYTK